MCANRDHPARRAFTLLEMVVALMITAMIVFTIYRFVSAHLTVINTTIQMGDERDALNTVARIVQTQLDALPVVLSAMQPVAVTGIAPGGVPPGGAVPNIASRRAQAMSGALTGKPKKFHGLSNDEITWTCPAGPGLLTTAAPGEYEVTLTVQPVDAASSETELGLRRRPTAENKTSVDLKRGGDAGRYDWLPLIRPMAMLEIRYYDQGSHSWTDQWSDMSLRPVLVRLRLQKRAEDAPVEVVIGVPSVQISR